MGLFWGQPTLDFRGSLVRVLKGRRGNWKPGEWNTKRLQKGDWKATV